ncbi:MAG: beta-ketoacyl synthase N-terminal-like domain-containing protein [Syntrophotaleaceae bacterium]
MNRMAIQGVGVVGGFGCGIADLEDRLEKGGAEPTELAVTAGGEEVSFLAFQADPSPLERFLNKRQTRRIDHFSKMALLGAHLALEDAGALDAPRDRMGVVIATGYGPTRTTFAFLDSVLEDGDAFASPTHFSNSVHNAAAAHVAIQLKATGPSLTVSQFGMSVASALLTARQWLAEGRVHSVLFGAVDEVCAVLGYCWDSFFPGSGGPIEPFVFDRQTAVPGEGAAFFLLTRDEQARYGHVSRLDQGRIRPQMFSGGTWLLNADGHRACSVSYRDILTGAACVAASTPCFGSLPVGQGFDLAVAALAVRNGRLPATSGAGQLPGDWRSAGGMVLEGLSCLKCDGDGNFGLIEVERNFRA